MTKFTLSPEQKRAAKLAASGKNLLITGVAGCVDGDTEFLTPTGWKKIRDYQKGDMVLGWSQLGYTKFSHPTEYISAPVKSLTKILTTTVDMVLSGNHRLPILTSKRNFAVRTLNELLTRNRFVIPRHFYAPDILPLPISDDLLRVLIMQSADGHILPTKRFKIRINVKKERKKERVIELLKKAGIAHTTTTNDNGFLVVTYYPPEEIATKELQLLWGASKQQLIVAFHELVLWDGTITNRKNVKTMRFTGTKANVDIAQYVFSAISGRYASITKDRRKYAKEDIYSVSLSSRSSSNIEYFKHPKERFVSEYIPMDGRQYCFTMPSGFWLARRGGKIFPTGNSGKSHLLKHLSEDMPKSLAVTATTGIAAVGIGGQTIHSFAGIGLGKEPVDIIFKNLNPRAYDRIEAVEVLIIDEISMLSPELFEKLDRLFREVLADARPFGGVQLVLFGDYLQLAPVTPGEKTSYAFESESWTAAGIETVMLTHVFRQSDAHFVGILNEIRQGRLSPDGLATLQSRCIPPPAGLDPVLLTSKNDRADSINLSRLTALPGNAGVYTAEESGNPFAIDKLRKSLRVPMQLPIKVGARVMMVCNKHAEDGIVNGSTGIVVRHDAHSVTVDFDGVGEYLVEWFDFEYGEFDPVMKKTVTQAKVKQIPLILAWAITVHKAQGAQFPVVRIEMQEFFAEAQAYVALSRCTSLDGIYLSGLDPKRIKANKKALAFYKKKA